MDNSWDTNVPKWKSLKRHFYTVWLFTQIQFQIILFLLFWDVLWIINDLLSPLSLFFQEFQQNSQFLRTISNYPDLGRLRIPCYSYINLPFLKRDNPYKKESRFLKRVNNSNIKLSILYLCLNCQNMQWDKTVYLRKMYILLFFGYQTYQFLLPKNGK